MTLIELMIERTTPPVAETAPDRRIAGHWLGWFVRSFSWLEGQSDWNRKV